MRTQIEAVSKAIIAKKNEAFMANFADNIRSTLDEVKALMATSDSTKTRGAVSVLSCLALTLYPAFHFLSPLLLPVF